MESSQKPRITRAMAAVGVAVALSLGSVGLASAAPSAQVASSARGIAAKHAAAAPDQAVGACDKVGSSRAPKTRFLLHAGLGFGAFHRYIYKPLKNGRFSASASGRTKAFVKAAFAGAFVIREIFQMDKFANADKTLCKITPNIAGIKAALGDLITKLKGGTANQSDLTNTSDMFDSLQSQAGSLGANIKDNNSKIPGV